MDKLIKALKPLKQRIFAEKIIKYILAGLILGLFLNMTLIIFSKFKYISSFYFFIILFPVLGIIFSMIVFYFRKPKLLDIIKTADKLGFKERFITAYELSKNKNMDIISNTVIKDAVDKAENADFKNMYNINISLKYIKILLVMLVFSFLVGFIPSPNSEKILVEYELNQKIKDEIKSIKSTKSNLGLNDNKEVDKSIKELEKELKESNTEAEAIKAIQKSQKELKEISKNSISNKLMEIGEKLEKNEYTKALGEQIKTGDVDKINDSIDNLNNDIKSMNKDERKKLGEELEKAASEMSENSEAQNPIQKLSDNLKEDDLKDITDNLDDFSDEIEKMIKENKELRDALEKLNESMAESAKNIDAEEYKQDNKESDNKSNGSDNQQNGKENKNGNSIENEENKSNEQANSSQSNQSYSKTGSNENDENKGKTAEDYGEYEAKIDAGKSQEQIYYPNGKKTIGTNGGYIPYKNVYEQYKNEALSTLEDSEIPFGLQEIVKDYFSSLD